MRSATDRSSPKAADNKIGVGPEEMASVIENLPPTIREIDFSCTWEVYDGLESDVN